MLCFICTPTLVRMEVEHKLQGSYYRPWVIEIFNQTSIQNLRPKVTSLYLCIILFVTPCISYYVYSYTIVISFVLNNPSLFCYFFYLSIYLLVCFVIVFSFKIHSFNFILLNYVTLIHSLLFILLLCYLDERIRPVHCFFLFIYLYIFLCILFTV